MRVLLRGKNFQHFSSFCCRRRSYSTNGRLAANEVRRMFIDYFRSNDHVVVLSSSVIPDNDPSLFFTNAGMNQFKSTFLDSRQQNGSVRRAVNSQKCIRVTGKHNDLDVIGDDSHHTFFEMLGSWSFGDYFKEEACYYAWTLLTDVYRIPKEHLFVTYFGGDAELKLGPDIETRDIWRKIGLTSDQVIPCGADENFWEMGPTGPCGPCTEIHFNDKLLRTTPVELWNLVFIQFNRSNRGALEPLVRKHVDTGAGLERLVAVLNGAPSNYETDLFRPIFDHISTECSSLPYNASELSSDEREHLNRQYRILADHSRTTVVAIADGCRPGDDFASQILRRILRRAVLCAQETFKARPGFLADLAPVVVDTLSDAYPELRGSLGTVMKVINEEEHRYTALLSKAEIFVRAEINQAISEAATTLSGKKAWQLYHRHAIPLEVTCKLAEQQGLNIDLQGYERCLKDEQEATKRSIIQKRQSTSAIDPTFVAQLKQQNIGVTTARYFNYYYDAQNNEQYVFPSVDANVCALWSVLDNKSVDSVSEGSDCVLVLNQTNFYPTSGGQLCDLGVMESSSNDTVIDVRDVIATDSYVFHFGAVRKGAAVIGDTLKLNIDKARRLRLMRNHTATHLLNFALRHVFGADTEQCGSLITEQQLRFDFNATKRPNMAQLRQVECICRSLIDRALPVSISPMQLQQAKEIPGIRAQFSETYSDDVRVVAIGGNGSTCNGQLHPVEFCAGTHVLNTADIGGFTLMSEDSVRIGVRRVTARTDGELVEIENSMEAKKYHEEMELLRTTKDGGMKHQCIQKAISTVKSDETLPLIVKLGLEEAFVTLAQETSKRRKSDRRRIQDLISQEATDIGAENQKSVFVHCFRTEDAPTEVLRVSRTKLGPVVSAGMLFSRNSANSGFSSFCWASEIDAKRGLKADEWLTATLDSAGLSKEDRRLFFGKTHKAKVSVSTSAKSVSDIMQLAVEYAEKYSSNNEPDQ